MLSSKISLSPILLLISFKNLMFDLKQELITPAQAYIDHNKSLSFSRQKLKICAEPFLWGEIHKPQNFAILVVDRNFSSEKFLRALLISSQNTSLEPFQFTLMSWSFDKNQKSILVKNFHFNDKQFYLFRTDTNYFEIEIVDKGSRTPGISIGLAGKLIKQDHFQCPSISLLRLV